MVGRQTPLLALFVPLILVGMVDGRRGIRQTWPAAVVGGSSSPSRSSSAPTSSPSS
jgi:lactate permease